MRDGGEPARAVRRYRTSAERRFWTLLYPWRVSGWHFRRQGRVGPFVVDVVCKRNKVVFNIVGEADESAFNANRNDNRIARLNARGYRVVRIHHADLRHDPDGVAARLNEIFGTTWPTDIASLTRRMAEVYWEE
jgi:very-short-patch-repair endonuclease